MLINRSRREAVLLLESGWSNEGAYQDFENERITLVPAGSCPVDKDWLAGAILVHLRLAETARCPGTLECVSGASTEAASGN